MKKQSEINLTITLDENKLPENISWQASDAGMEKPANSKAFFLSIWDPADKSTLRVDLWTKDMPVDEMKRFFYESLVTLADTYQRATGDEENTEEVKKFAKAFGEKTQVLKK